MYIVLVLLSLVYAVVPLHIPTQLGVQNFNFVTDCVLGHWGLRYNNYGCYCGYGGSGKPIDKVDECCQMHDNCYDAAVKNKFCPPGLRTYVWHYKWTCDKKGKENKAKCDPTNTGCAAALCICDTACVQCWKEAGVKPNLILPNPGCPKK